MKLVYIIHGSPAYNRLFERFGWGVTKNIEEASLVLFTGGEDVSPKLYGDNQHPTTFCNMARDEAEMALFKEARSRKIPVAGICRGAQFLNVMSGGRMYQHVSSHTRDHILIDATTDVDKEVLVSSTHHQMMMPSDSAIILATAREQGSRQWFDGTAAKRDVSEEDIEVVYYPETNALCFQPHPEMSQAHGDQYGAMARLFFKYIRNWSLT